MKAAADPPATGKAAAGSITLGTLEEGSDSSSDSGGSQQATGVSSGMAPVAGLGARMTFDGDEMSDDEANSWEDSLSENDGSAGCDDYYDQEDYGEESPQL